MCCIDQYVFDRMGKVIRIEAGFYGRHLVWTLVDQSKMPTSKIKYFICTRKTLAPDTFKTIC